MEYYDILLILLTIFGALILFLIAVVEDKVKCRWFRLLYLVPGLIVWIMGGVTGFEKDLFFAYTGGSLLLLGFLLENEKLRKVICSISVGLVLLSLLFCIVDPGYRCPDFMADFEEGLSFLEEHYCLSQYKEIDYDALYQKYYPKFQQAQKEHSKEKNYIAWHEMLCEFQDGHTYFVTDKDVMENAQNMMFGSDFGFSMMTLSDGRNVAVNVEPGSEAEKAGISLGTEILTMDGKSVDECKKEVKHFIYVIPDQETEAFYRACYAAGREGDELQVSFVDDKGEKIETTLNSLGYYKERLKKTLDTVNQGRNIGTLTFEEIDDKTVLYRIKEMSYDNKSVQDGDYSLMEQEIRGALLNYKERGFTRLILDIRNNCGGSPDMILAIARILSTEGEHFYMNYGVIDEKTGEYVFDEKTQKYKIDGSLSYQGENLWNQGEIFLLVNAECVSAGDHFTNMMHGQDNVKIIGFTKSNGSGQAMSCHVMKSGAFSFSMVPTLDKDGNIDIDTNKNRIANVYLDEKIPFDEKAMKSLFEDGEDYLLEKACE